MRCIGWLAAAVAVGVVLCAQPAVAIVEGAPPASADRRFDAVGAFGTAWHLGLQPSHPDAADHDWHCVATLIAPGLIITYEPCVTGSPSDDGYVVRFRRNEQDGLGSKLQGPQSYFHSAIASWVMPDFGYLALGILSEPVTHIEPIPIAVPDTTLMWPAGSACWLAGWGLEGPGYSEGEQNELLLCQSETEGVSSDQIYMLDPWAGDPLCGVNTHDEGAPMLLEATDGELRVVGMAAYSYSQVLNLALYADDPSAQLPFVPYSGVDLVVNEPPTEPTELLLPGATFEVELAISNLGASDASSSVVTAHLSPDRWFDADDIPLSSSLAAPPVSAGGTETITGSLEVPAGTPGGAFCLVLSANGDDGLVESIPINNRWQSPPPLVFVHPNPVDHEGIHLGAVTAIGSDEARGFFGAYRRTNGTAAVFAFDTVEERGYLAEAAEVSSAGMVSFEVDGIVVTIDLSAEPVSGDIGGMLALLEESPSSTHNLLPMEGYYRSPLGEAHAVVRADGDGYLFIDAPGFTRGFEFDQNWSRLNDGFESGTLDLALAGRFDWDAALQVHVVRGGVLSRDGLVRAVELYRENTPPPPADIGDPCDEDWACRLGNGGEEATCLSADDGWPGGYCVVTGCEDPSCPAGSECVAVAIDGSSDTACLQSCAPEDEDCRADYACHVDGDTEGTGVCRPGCQTDDDCPRPLVCNLDTGLCEQPQPPPSPPPPADDSSSSDCSMAASKPSSAAWLAWVAALAFALRLRRSNNSRKAKG